MSERPREETQERYIDQWPKPMFLCTHCDEQTDSDPCQECASVFDERGENYPPVLRFQVVPAPAQPEQPREGEARVDWPAKPQRGECVVGDSVWWSHDWNGNRTRCFRCGYKPALPSEQPPTRVDCPFCDYEGPSEVLYHGRFDYIIEPLNPVTPGHLLIIPHAHVSDFADVGTVSGEAIRTAAWWVSTKDRDGDYNLITSKGEAASQTIEHLHFHLIPRRKGDGLVLPWSDPAPPSEQPREGEAG